MGFLTDPVENDSLPISQNEMRETFLHNILNGKRYKEVGEVTAYQTLIRINVVTALKSGVEMINTANPGDWVVTNPGGESYVLKDSSFKKRYTPLEDFPSTIPQRYKPEGEIMAYQYKGKDF